MAEGLRKAEEDLAEGRKSHGPLQHPMNGGEPPGTESPPTAGGAAAQAAKGRRLAASKIALDASQVSSSVSGGSTGGLVDGVTDCGSWASSPWGNERAMALGAAGSHECPEGYSEITDVGLCRAAAESRPNAPFLKGTSVQTVAGASLLGTGSTGPKAEAELPSGCLLHTASGGVETLHLNAYRTHAARVGPDPIGTAQYKLRTDIPTEYSSAGEWTAKAWVLITSDYDGELRYLHCAR